MQQFSALAIASIVLSSLTVIIGPFGCVPGIVCGHLARRRIASDPELHGAALATAGLIVGYVLLAVLVLAIILLAMQQHVPSAPDPG